MIVASRRGVTLIELLIAMVVSVGLGASVMSLLMTSTRFEERAEAQRSARMVARSGVNIVMNDIRPVDPSWGIEAAAATSITVKSPYALGMVCDTTGRITVALLPTDSVIFAIPGYSGFAWRSANGTYTTVTGGTLASTYTVPAVCTSSPASITAITAPASAPNQKTLIATITGTSRTGIAIGSILMLYRRARFYFANSAQTGLTTRTALWRNYLDAGSPASPGSPTEMVVPFASTAAFHFFISGSSTSQTTVPADLTTLRGFELFLPGQSENTPRLRSAPEEADLTTAVFFLNAAT